MAQDRLAATIGILEKLVAFDTESTKSNLDIVAFVENHLTGLGVTTLRLPNAAGDKAALFATVGPARDGGVVLSCHSDVVPVAGQAWSSDPFRLRREADRLYGRGACDMKGFVAACLATMESYARQPLNAPIHFLMSYDEETTCLGPVDAINRFGSDLPRPGAVIVGEPTLMEVADAHKSVVAFSTKVFGRAAHSSNPPLGASASGKRFDAKGSGETHPLEDIRNIVHGTGGAAHCVQLRGEYLYVAEGKGGFRAYDVASVANKGFSDKIVGAPFSPLADRTHIATTNATCMALPTDQPINPNRNTPALRAMNQEQAFHPIYNYAVVTDAAEGLIVVDIDSLVDGDPRNNNLRRALTWNPDHALDGARHIILAGHIAYVAANAGLVVVDLDDPLHPRITATLPVRDARASALQFRYLWVTSAEGVQLFDATDMLHPVALPQSTFPLANPQRIYVARTYAYVAAKQDGLVILDVKNPTAPKLYQRVTFDGQLNDAEDVIVGSTNASLFAYVADGKNGVKVIQLTSPASQPNFYGFSPAPKPELIAWAHTQSPALALSKGLDRDRAVDEEGGQIAVFGRIGSRPFTQAEMQRFFLNRHGIPWKVVDTPSFDDWVPAQGQTATR